MGASWARDGGRVWVVGNRIGEMNGLERAVSWMTLEEECGWKHTANRFATSRLANRRLCLCSAMRGLEDRRPVSVARSLVYGRG